MKKIFLSIIALCMGMCAIAQTKFYVYNTDGTMVEYTIKDIDSISFVGSDVATTTEPLPGVFTVAEGKTVKFAPGNLQYTQSTKKWSFAANQYDMIGLDNVTGGTVSSSGKTKSGTALADKIDLFGWSGDCATAPWGVSTSTNRYDYSYFMDWGKNIGDGKTWRTLTKDEWGYIFETRTNASSLYGFATVSDVKGLILLPDSWSLPIGLTFIADTAAFTNNVYTATQWTRMQSAGAVFLPAADERSGTSVDNYGVGNYWSSTSTGYLTTGAYILYFSDNYLNAEYSNARYIYYKGQGHAVRLVQNVE